MNKSDKLDELRLEVGMIAEQVSTQEDFYFGIIHTIARLLPPKFGVAIYLCFDNHFTCLVDSGKISEKKIVKYGDGMFSICSIRGKVTIHNEVGHTKAYAPFYDGHHLVGIFYAECQDINYDVTEEDLIFLKELTKFIENKGKQYSSIDNLEQ